MILNYGNRVNLNQLQPTALHSLLSNILLDLFTQPEPMLQPKILPDKVLEKNYLFKSFLFIKKLKTHRKM